MPSGEVVVDHLFRYRTPDFFPALAQHRLKPAAQLTRGAVLVPVNHLWQRTMAVVDNPTGLDLRVPDVPEGIELTVEGFVVLIVQRRSVQPEQLILRPVQRVRQAHRPQITVLAAGFQNVWRHVRVVAR